MKNPDRVRNENKKQRNGNTVYNLLLTVFPCGKSLKNSNGHCLFINLAQKQSNKPYTNTLYTINHEIIIRIEK
jgi:hypothetical protein